MTTDPNRRPLPSSGDLEVRKAIEEIARQKLSDSMSPQEYADADFEGGYDCCVRRARSVLASLQEPFQQRVRAWMLACFGGKISNDKLERGDRLLEEVLELLQSGDYPRERVTALLDYSYSREKGQPHQETGGVMVTLAAYCLAHGLDMERAGEDELARVWTKIDKIRAKQAAKPTGSALPVASLQEGGDSRDSVIEECAKVADEMRNKHGSPTGDAYACGTWDQGVRIAGKLRALKSPPRRPQHDGE